MSKLSYYVKADVAFETVDIGGTDCWGGVATAGWVSLAAFDSFMAKIEVGTWNAADTLDTLKLQQATDSTGTGVKDVSGKTITASAVVADGQTFTIECLSEDIDSANGFTHVRILVAETGNTGPDFVTGFYIRSKADYPSQDLDGATQRA